MLEDELPLLFIMFLLIPVAAYLVYVLYTRVQARTLEFMLTLIVATSPIGLLLNFAQEHNDLRNRVAVEKMVVLGLFPTLILFGCSIWALSVAKRLNEARTARRITLLVLGWLLTPGATAVFYAWFVLTFFGIEGWRTPIVFLIGLCGTLPICAAFALEKKCKATSLKPNANRTR